MNLSSRLLRAGLVLLAAASVGGASRAAVTMVLASVALDPTKPTATTSCYVMENDYLKVVVHATNGKVYFVYKKTAPSANVTQSSYGYPTLDRVNQAGTSGTVTLTANPDADDGPAKQSLKVAETINAGTGLPSFSVTKILRLRDASKYLEEAFSFANSSATAWTPVDPSNGAESIFYATPAGTTPYPDLVTAKSAAGLELPQANTWWGSAPAGTAPRPELTEGWMAFSNPSGVTNAITWDLAAQKAFSQNGVSVNKLYFGSDRFQVEPLFNSIPGAATLNYKQYYIVDDGIPVVSYAAPESVMGGITIDNNQPASGAPFTATILLNSTASTDASYDVINFGLEDASHGPAAPAPDIHGIAVPANAHVTAGSNTFTPPAGFTGVFTVRADVLKDGFPVTTLRSTPITISAGSTFAYKNGYVALDKANNPTMDDKYIGLTAGQERGIAVRPAKGTDPVIIYNARGGVSTGDAHGADSNATAAIAAVKLTPYNGSNYTDTGLILSATQTSADKSQQITWVQDLTYDAVTDKVWLWSGLNFGTAAAPLASVFTIDGGVVGGSPNGGDPTKINNAANWRFTTPPLLGLTKDDGSSATPNSTRGIGVRTVGNVSTVYLAGGNHLQVWKYDWANQTAYIEYATKVIPAVDTVDVRTLGLGRKDGNGINGVAVDAAGNCYVGQQNANYGRVWRFPGSRPADVAEGTLLDVDDRAMGGNNGGTTTSANVGIPVVIREPAGLQTPYGWQTNYSSIQNTEWFTDGVNQGLFVSYNGASVYGKAIARAVLTPLNPTAADPLVGTANGGPYIDATVEDTFGNGAYHADTSMQDSVLRTLTDLSGGQGTQPNAASNGLLYTQAMTDANGLFNGQLFVNAAVQDLSKNQGRSTYAYLDIAAAPMNPALPTIGISNPEVICSTSSQSVLARWTTSVPATQRAQAGPFVPQGVGSSDLVNVPDANGNYALNTQHEGIVGSVSVLPGQPFVGGVLAWAPGYQTTSKDAPFSSDMKVRAYSTTQSSPVVWNNVTYFGAADGKLYAMDNATGLAPAGFPYDAMAGSPKSVSGIYSRPALYFLNGETQPTIFFTTLDCKMHAVNLDGSRRWFCDLTKAGWSTGYTAFGFASSSTPALIHLDAGDFIFVGGIGKKAAADTESRLIKVDALTGAIVATSPVLGKSTTVLVSISSPAIAAGKVCVGISNPYTGLGPVVTLNTDFTPSVSAGPTSETANGSPYIMQNASGAPVLYLGSSVGKVYALNLNTAAPVAGFGASGMVQLPNPSAAQSNLFGWAGKVYIANSSNNVFALDAATGAGAGPGGSPLFLQTVTVGSIPGLVVDPRANNGAGALYAGSSDGYLYAVPLDNPAAYHSYTMLDGTSASPAVDPATHRVFLTAVDGNLYRFPGL
ncbi:MAG TPA: PQQ-binding-like beta-propeller repeat protein [Armatimonadota bacterium]|jgi:hypothetical protein